MIKGTIVCPGLYARLAFAREPNLQEPGKGDKSISRSV